MVLLTDALRRASARTSLVALALAALPFATLRGQQATMPDTARRELKARIRSVSPAVAMKRAALDVARARRLAAGLPLAATLSAEVEEVPDFAAVHRAQSIRVDVGRELVPRSRRDAERALSDAAVERAAIELEISEGVLAATIDQLVIRAAGSAAIAARLASADSLLDGAEEALRARFAVADARYVDVLRLRTERLRVETEQRRAFAEGRIARRQLLRLAPPPDSALVSLVDAAIRHEALQLATAALPPLPPIDSLGAASMVRRLASLAVTRAEAARRLARADLRPAVTPSLGVQRYGEAGDTPVIGLTAGISLALPFTARTANRARLAVADREITLARAAQAAAEARLTAALALAEDRYETARAQLTAYDATLLRGARDEREAALAAYRSGAMSLLELVDFERALAQAEISRILGQIEASEALLEYLTTAFDIPEEEIR